ncbi:hypothetical protein AAG570_007399 [Ranatra chinensis]|uniref:Uncharacterized protein n=1 Tax=Ranatra chinensis TaxID=642074 RepID=A0ABD0YEA0_9HEMI
MYGKQQYLAGATSSGDLSTAYAAAVGSGAGGYHAVTDGSAARGKSMHQQQPAAQLGHQQPSRNVQQQMYQRQLQQMVRQLTHYLQRSHSKPTWTYNIELWGSARKPNIDRIQY